MTAADLRPEVLKFACLMEQKLRENDHKGGWRDDSCDALLDRLREETLELQDACDLHTSFASVGARNNLALEAADVANFAMMIADNAGGLP